MNTLVQIELEHITCGNCSAVYGLNADFTKKARENKASWWCPHCGDSRVFTTSKVEQLRESLAEKESQLQRTIARFDQVRTELRHAERRRRAEKGAKTRVKNRIANGVCPCCKRHFSNLHEHMQKLHPDFVQTVDREEIEKI